MAIPAVTSAVANVALPSLPSLPAGAGVEAAGSAATTGAGAPAPVGGPDFGDLLSDAVESVVSAQARADRLAVDAATGRLTDVHDYMIAATEATLATELTVAVRNKAVEAFNQIMSMPV